MFFAIVCESNAFECKLNETLNTVKLLQKKNCQTNVYAQCLVHTKMMFKNQKKKLKMKKWEVKQLVALLIDRMHIKVSYGELTEK